MLEISFWKIILVAVVALIVLGPEQLPRAARSVGRLLKELKKGLASVQKEIAGTIKTENDEPEKESDK
ncbi:MAG: twin-arginine translocase subunit TatB [Gammaproteobacteria bacterium]|nr:twin-arginine translocase subunit TatB [Gammaproteobacteria bacterium]